MLTGFGAGVVLVRRYAPPLAATREGQMVCWLVAILVGASLALIVDAVWIAVRALTTDTNALGFGDTSEGIIITTVRNLLVDASLPLALAAILHQLGPGPVDALRNE
jgi:hypothetical protein